MTRPCEKDTTSRRRPQKPPLCEVAPDLRVADAGLTPDEAIEEAKRCLGSQRCESCEICSLLCPDLCIARDETTGKVLIDLNYCKGCGICAAVCPKGAIVMAKEE